jgi:hypothetical protein
MMLQSKRQAIFLFFILFTFILSHPTVTWSAELDSLSVNSDVIVFGKTLETQCQWAETSLNILTHTTFQVERCVKGHIDSGDTVIIETYGGTINGMKQKVSNAPTFQGGNYALVFLTSGSNGRYYVVQDKEGMIPFANKTGKPLKQKGKGLSHMIQDVNLALGR